MASRRKGRELALQMLYQADATGAPMPEVAQQFWIDRRVADDLRRFADRLALGTAAALPAIDALLTESLEHWRLDRLALVDRNILRLATFEFLHEPDTPRIVIIDEAIEVAKRFGGEESGQFVNGILDALRRRLEGAGPHGASGDLDPERDAT
jgi:transcription antitermination protein NusB